MFWSSVFKCPLIFPRMPLYAVAKGRVPGIYKTWDECKAQCEKFSGAAFKKFNSEAECKQFIAEKSGHSLSHPSTSRGSSSSTPAIPSVAATIPNPVAQRALFTKPSGSKLSRASSGTPPGRVARTTKFTAPQRNASSDSTPADEADRAFLANLGSCLKRRSTNHHDTRRSKMGRYDFEMDKLGFVHIYTDGSCVNNGKMGARAGYGVYFGEDHPLNLSEPVRGRPTNNSGEIQAAIHALRLAKEQGLKKVCINTDSHFVINSITMWVPGWKRKGWKLANGEPVKNEIDFKALDKLYSDDSMEIKWNYVKAHIGTLGNERADELAKAGADRWTKANYKR